MKDKKLNYWFIVVFFILVTISMSIYDFIKENKRWDLEREKYVEMCQAMEDIDQCIVESEKSLLFKKRFEEGQEPVFDVSKTAENLFISLILFFVVRFLLSINQDL